MGHGCSTTASSTEPKKTNNNPYPGAAGGNSFPSEINTKARDVGRTANDSDEDFGGYRHSDTSSVPDEDAEFKEAVQAIFTQLKKREQTGKPYTKEEMEDFMVLTREIGKVKESTKNSEHSVASTWGILERENMVERFGQQLYDELLSSNANLRVYFYGVDLDEQASTIVRMLSLAVQSYGKDNHKHTTDMLLKAGARHRGYGVTGEILSEMRAVFFRVFPKFVGKDVFNTSRDQWDMFWDEVLLQLSRGASSSEGEIYARSYEKNNAKKIEEDWNLICTRQAKCDTRHQFVGVMYACAIEMFGDLSKFEALKDLRFANRVFESLTYLIKNINSDVANEYMYDLGKRHYAYSVSIENMKSFTEPFLVACRKFLVEEWNVTRESRFLWFFNDIVTKINKGIADGETTQVSTEGVEGSASVFCLVYTDIEACDKLWKVNAAAMAHAVKQHNKVIRALIKRFSGYEVSRVENSFSVALKDAFTGLQFALAVQLEFMRIAPIAKEFQMIEGTEGRGDSSCWDPRTLRVRISVEHCTQANCVLDEVTNTYVYSGPSVNRCASILNVTCGGQILMAKETYQEIVNTPAFHDEPCDPFYRDLDLPSIETVGDNSSVGLDHFVHIEKAGTATNLKGIGYPVELISVTPRCLSGRKFIDKISYRKK